jgi:hypothetical protein
MYKHWIVVIAVGAVIWFGMRWLYRYHPLAFELFAALGAGIKSRHRIVELPLQTGASLSPPSRRLGPARPVQVIPIRHGLLDSEATRTSLLVCALIKRVDTTIARSAANAIDRSCRQTQSGQARNAFSDDFGRGS